MKSFTKGILVGIGVGLLIAPMKGREMRHVLVERMTEWRDSLPEDSPLNRCARRVSAQVTSAKENWRVYARQAVSKAKDTGATLSDKARHTGQEVASKAKQTGQDLAERARQTGQEMASKAKQTVGRTSSDGSRTRVISETNG
jgi:gas vesicle protein